MASYSAVKVRRAVLLKGSPALVEIGDNISVSPWPFACSSASSAKVDYAARRASSGAEHEQSTVEKEVAHGCHRR